MADEPWNKITLSRGQVAQRLKDKGCHFIKDHTPTASMWKAPTGQVFSISYEKCNATYLEGIVEQLEKWADESRNKR